MGKQLAEHFSASVKTTDTVVVPTAMGAIPQPVEVFVEAGGTLPDNLAEGEEARLERLGAFTPLKPYTVRLYEQGARLADTSTDVSAVDVNAMVAHDTQPAGLPSTAPGIVVREDSDDLPPPLPDGAVDPHGRVSADVAHDSAPQGEAVGHPLSTEDITRSVQEQVPADVDELKSHAEHARARAAKKSAK